MGTGRSGYDESGDIDNIRWINWRGAVLSAIRGKRGQAFLRELRDAMDAMPIKRLIDEELVDRDRGMMSISHWGMHEVECEGFCTLGVIGKARGLNLRSIDVDDYSSIGQHFNIAQALATEIEYENDYRHKEDPADRFVRMRKWVEGHIK